MTSIASEHQRYNENFISHAKHEMQPRRRSNHIWTYFFSILAAGERGKICGVSRCWLYPWRVLIQSCELSHHSMHSVSFRVRECTDKCFGNYPLSFCRSMLVAKVFHFSPMHSHRKHIQHVALAIKSIHSTNSHCFRCHWISLVVVVVASGCTRLLVVDILKHAIDMCSAVNIATIHTTTHRVQRRRTLRMLHSYSNAIKCRTVCRCIALIILYQLTVTARRRSAFCSTIFNSTRSECDNIRCDEQRAETEKVNLNCNNLNSEF